VRKNGSIFQNKITVADLDHWQKILDGKVTDERRKEAIQPYPKDHPERLKYENLVKNIREKLCTLPK